MSLIEGIGDEVTVLFTCLLVITVIVVAWMSTHVDVRTLTSVVIIDRERFAELLRRVRGIAVRNNFGETDAHVTSHSSASAAAAHAATDSLLVSGAAAGDYLNDAKPQSSCRDGAHNYRSSDGEHGCSHESEACGSSDNASNNTDSVSPLPEVGAATATAATCNKTSSQCSSAMGSDIPPGSIQVRLQFVDGCQRTVIANPDDTIGHFKRSHFASELASNLVVRFIAGGQELKDETYTLRSHRIAFSGAVLHCLVTPGRATVSPADDQQNIGYQFDVSILMFPLFGTLLAALWYARVVYRGYFNGTSTFSLLAISFLYVVALLASLRGGGQADRHPHVE